MRTIQLNSAAARWLCTALLLAAGVPALSGCSTNGEANVPPAAATESEQQQFVDHARLAVEALRSNSAIGPQVNSYLQDAKAVLVFPDLLRGGFFVGASGGNAALLVRNRTGGWSDPVFYFLGNASFGLQIGGEGGQVLFAVMNNGAVNKILDGNSINLGADVSVAAGPLGGGATGATTNNLGADLVAFSLQQGAFAGAAAGLGVLHPRQDWNSAYYGPGATPRAIVYENRFNNPGDRGLKTALATLREPGGSAAMGSSRQRSGTTGSAGSSTSAGSAERAPNVRGTTPQQ
jgi:lipid-binding SYLF domain-containing protein